MTYYTTSIWEAFGSKGTVIYPVSTSVVTMTPTYPAALSTTTLALSSEYGISEDVSSEPSQTSTSVGLQLTVAADQVFASFKISALAAAVIVIGFL